VAQIEGGKMLHIGQVVQGYLLRVELIDISDDTADTVNGDLASGFKIDNHVIVKGKEIEVLVDVLDYINHHVGAFRLVVEASDGVLEQNVQKLLPQRVVLFGMTLVGVGPVACLGKVREVLRKIVGADLDHRYNIILPCGFQAVDFVAGIGEYIAFLEGICAVAVLEQYLAFEHENKLRILMIVDRIFFNVGYCYVYGETILV
jgi:hypothetical protein